MSFTHFVSKTGTVVENYHIELQVNDMDMTGITREEAVLFLLSLQDRIELIVQYCKEEYDNIVGKRII